MTLELSNTDIKTESNNNIKNIIWDFDGTLVDTYPVMAKSLLKAISELGVKSNYDVVYERLKISLSEAIDFFSNGDFQKSLDIRGKFEQYERDENPSSYDLFPDTTRTLSYLHEKGIKHYVLTHRNSSTYRIMKAKGIDKYISDVVISDDGFKRKPDPEAFNYLIDKHNLNKSETLSVGDRLFDVQAGKNAEIIGCLILDKYNRHFTNKVDITVECRWDIVSYFSKQ